MKTAQKQTRRSGTAPGEDRGAALPGHAAGKTPIDGRSARWASHRAQRRRELIRSARRAVHQLGPDASMEEIATAARTSKSVFYRYFGDKAGLQTAVGELVIGKMQHAVLAAARSGHTGRVGLKNMVLAYLKMAQTSPNVYVFATQAPDAAEGEHRVQGIVQATGALGGFFDAITSMVTSPLAEALGPQDSVQRRFWPTAALGFVRTAGEQWLDSPATTRPSPEEMAEAITDWLYLGLAADRTSELLPSTTNAAGKAKEDHDR